MKIIDKMKKEKIILTVLDNMMYFYRPEKIADKKIRKVIEKFKTREEVYLYLLKKVGKPLNPVSIYICMTIYGLLGAKYRKECIEYTKMYLDNILIGEVRRTQELENKTGYPINLKEAETMYRCVFYYSLSDLEYKEKNYDEALKYIDIVLETNPKLKSSYIIHKVNILKKLKIDIVPFLEEMKTKEEYQIELSMEDINNYPGRLKTEATRKYFFKKNVDDFLQKELAKREKKKLKKEKSVNNR